MLGSHDFMFHYISTVSIKMQDMGCDIECELITETGNRQCFATQALKCSDADGLCTLLSFLRFLCKKVNQVEEEMLV